MDTREALRTAWGEDQFVGGALALDFANTFNDRPSGADPEDRLVSYGALIRWAVAAGGLDPDARQALDGLAAAHPAAAAAVLDEARALRLALLHLFAGAAAPAGADLALLERHAQAARAHQHLVAHEHGIAWAWPAPDQAPGGGAALAPGVLLARPLWPVALSALDILTDAQARALTRQCAGQSCSWVFLDTTKNHRRRWCDMATCGNRAKAHRHYTRRRGADPAPGG
ncbi:CGNR zinc finger domain-containing protein [Zavarzinia sp. CC-PAN008]|uniref:CGNR zinc finger domain-containing protein n=1 Tax=Zavarzinia sp. CC-PAN008 TaxID=3243332 RepID=UPI003F7486BC